MRGFARVDATSLFGPMDHGKNQPDPKQETYCRRLGHPVTLEYCARESVDLPCRLVFECWAGRVPIHDFLLTLYTKSELETIEKPTSKLASLIDILSRVRS